MSRLNDVIFTGTHWHPIATLISTLLKLEISTLLKTITNSCFQALEGLKFQALEGLKSNAKPDESNYCFCDDVSMTKVRIDLNIKSLIACRKFSYLLRVLSSNSALHLVYELTSVCVLKITMNHFWGFLDPDILSWIKRAIISNNNFKSLSMNIHLT